MKQSENPLYSAETIAFFKAVNLFCTTIENSQDKSKKDFIKGLMLSLSSLYTAALTLPEFMEDFLEDELETYVTEELYMAVEEIVKQKLGAEDNYLTTQCVEMKYSDTPVLHNISEDVADIYQAVCDALKRLQSEQEQIMTAAMVECVSSFKEYWGLNCVRALEALHTIAFSSQEEDEEEDF
ncbi:MAG: DUF5063 domain-containing protein [Paludibacteraceae bacterium]|nr:DUF5063 domain-containing protein [Paludibacteraceae bacterium]